MALKVSEKQKKVNEEHEQHVRRGKNAKRKGGTFENLIAKVFGERYGVELKRTPQSGGFAKKSTLADDYRGDITIVNPKQYLKLHIECKAHKTWALPQWLLQAESDCPNGRTPIVVFHQHGTSNNYVALEYFSFINLLRNTKGSDVTIEPPTEEEWRPITNFDGYFVSNLGRVISIRPNNGKGGFTPNNPTYLKSGTDSSGYQIVVLRKDNKSHSKRVHKLVAKEFLGIDGDVLINHLDGDKTHNWSTNLEQSNHSNNLQHAYDTGLRPKGEALKVAKLSDLQVSDIRLKLMKGESVDCEDYGVSKVTIDRISDEGYRNPCGLHFVYHNQKTWSLPKWIAQAEEDCPKNQIPLVVFHQHNTSNDYVCLKLDDFLKLVDKDKVVGRREIK